ncbi:MAG: nucleotidyltransferase family protein [Pseudomonadota bacterium]
MKAPNSAMILAAGFGTRMGALTQDTPKPMLPMGGRPLIEHGLDIVAAAGATRVVLNLHYLGDQVRTYLADRTSPRVLFSEEQPEILDTGGGLKHALPLLGYDPVYSLNSDAVFRGPNPLVQLSEAWDPTAMDVLLHMVPVKQAHAYTRAGDFFLNAEGGAPQRRGPDDSAPLVYTGAQIIAPHVFAGTPDGPFSMNLIWDRLLAEGRLAAVTYPGQWVDVGTPEGLETAERVLADCADHLDRGG